MYIASVIGLIVATYIGVAEYTVKQSPLTTAASNAFQRVFRDDE